MTKRQMGPLVKAKKEEIKDHIKTLIDSGLIHGVRKGEICKRFDISYSTLKNLTKQAWKEFPVENAENICHEFQQLYNRMFREANYMLASAETKDEKERAIRLITHLTEKRTDILERFFIKPKAVENVNVQSNQPRKIEVEIIETTQIN